MPPVLGLIAGGSRFPHAVAQAARAQSFRVVGVGFAPDTDPNLPEYCDAFAWLRLGQLGRLVGFFRRQRVSHVSFVGPIHKPRALSLIPDWRATRLLLSLRQRGDDAILRAVRREMEKEGWQVVGADFFLPQLLTPEGILTQTQPTPRQWEDIHFGWRVAECLGQFDIGQCVVVREGVVLAVEAIEGTDATLARAAALGGKGAVVIKRCKPTQDRALDLPSVGLTTVQGIAAMGGSCLAVEAGGSFFFDLEASIQFATAHGIALVGYTEMPSAASPPYSPRKRSSSS